LSIFSSADKYEDNNGLEDIGVSVIVGLVFCSGFKTFISICISLFKGIVVFLSSSGI